MKEVRNNDVEPAVCVEVVYGLGIAMMRCFRQTASMPVLKKSAKTKKRKAAKSAKVKRQPKNLRGLVRRLP
jgi:hypothetical protein